MATYAKYGGELMRKNRVSFPRRGRFVERKRDQGVMHGQPLNAASERPEGGVELGERRPALRIIK